MRLVFSGPSGYRIIGQEGVHGFVGIEKPEFLPGFPKLCMEPGSFRGIKMDFGFGEKVQVFLHRLPVLDHSVVAPCNCGVVVYVLITRARLVTKILLPNALHNSDTMSIVF